MREQRVGARACVDESREKEREERRRREKRKEEKEKGKNEKKKKREEKERERRSVGFAATIGSMRRLRRNTMHAERGEQRDEMVISAGVGTADCREGFRKIRSSDGKGFRNDLSSTMKKKFKNYY